MSVSACFNTLLKRLHDFQTHCNLKTERAMKKNGDLNIYISMKTGQSADEGHVM